MSKEIKIPDFIFESSWEVCNKVGGIYTVLSTRARTLQLEYKDRIVFIGPDLEGNNSSFVESPRLLATWKKQAVKEGLKIRIGRWIIPGKPIAVLVDFKNFYAYKEQIYTECWKLYKVDSLRAYGDYDESCMFAYACGAVIKSYFNFNGLFGQNVIAHFNEWTTGMGLLYCKHFLPEIATVFTTHATSIGRSICGNNKPLYDFLSDYNGDQMARELNMVSKHSLEKTAAREADCFTTVSNITAKECKQLLEKKPDVITLNGFEDQFVPKGEKEESVRQGSRDALTKVAEALFGYDLSEDPLFVGISGRYEVRNKGIDVFIDALNSLKGHRSLEHEIVAFIMVPGDVSAPRSEVLDRLQHPEIKQHSPIYFPYITHWMNHIESDSILNMMKYRGFKNSQQEKVKIVYIPCYLNGNDGVFNKTYYDLLSGLDLTVFPSYYEPWGYTPLESIAFSVPTITTSLAGFGAWAIDEGDEEGISDGVAVISRSDHNYKKVTEEIAWTILDYARKSNFERTLIAQRARTLSKKALWSEFILNYKQAYSYALRKSRLRNNLLNK
jgi:glycosyltransferase involved in cell wall biosynthesis